MNRISCPYHTNETVNTTVISDLNITTEFECVNTTSTENHDWYLDIDLCNLPSSDCSLTSEYQTFEARSIRVASLDSNYIPMQNWTFQGYDLATDTWTILLNLGSEYWYTGTGDCAEWGTPISIPLDVRGFYQKYRLNANDTDPQCCHISELEINGVGDSAWLEASAIVTTGAGVVYTSVVKSNFVVVEPATPSIAQVDEGQLEVALQEQLDSFGGTEYTLTIQGRGFDNIEESSEGRVVVHLYQKIPGESCCTILSTSDTMDLDTMKRFLQFHDRYIEGTKDNTMAATCSDTVTDITCYFGSTNDSWTREHNSLCPCRATVTKATEDNAAAIPGTIEFQLRSWWFNTNQDQIYFKIQDTVYASVEIVGAERMSEISGIAVAQGKPGIVQSVANLYSNTAKLTIAGTNLADIPERNIVLFRVKNCTGTL